MNSERVTPKNAAKELQMDVITLRELMKREKLPIGYEFEIYDLAKAINSDDARGGLVSHTELGVTRNWGQTGKKDIELALAKIPPKTYVGLLRRDGNAEAET